jgi:biotin synthase
MAGRKEARGIYSFNENRMTSLRRPGFRGRSEELRSIRMDNIPNILNKTEFAKQDIVTLLSASADIETIRRRAYRVLVDNCGTTVYFRGLIEFSNRCVNDCRYCGIRKSNSGVKRYLLTQKEIVETARFCAEQGYGSVVLQSGERHDEEFISYVEACVRTIKKETVSDALPGGVGITLCVGEQTRETYQRFFAAGAHRYLLRIETTNPRLFREIHPPEQTLEARVECLRDLKSIGFQVGTGVMIGLPGQTIPDLADDIMFFQNQDVDMIGMGPYIVHEATPMNIHRKDVAERKDDILSLSLKMIAVTRLVLKNVNIASTTALQAMDPSGRELGLSFGANVVMPQATPVRVRHEYLLYEGKPCLDESAEHCKGCLERRIRSIGRDVGHDSWGDSRHFASSAERRYVQN